VCLIVTVRLAERDAARARDIAAAATASGTIEVAAVRRLFRGATRDLNICEPHQGCACSMLHDDASWDTDSWLMRPEVLPALACTLATIREHSSDTFMFETLWVGDDVYHERRVSFAELHSIVASGQIGAHTRYTVS
jgi:hypothetical protein